MSSKASNPPCNTFTVQPGGVRRIWRSLKRVPAVESGWRGLRNSYRSVRGAAMALSYVHAHARIRRQRWRKLQLGAGNNLLPGWLNTDLRASRSVLPIDAARTLPFDDNTFDYVLTEHMVEHLTRERAEAMLTEVHRVLAPGGTLRISTPDFDFLLGLFRADLADDERDFVTWHTQTYSPRMPEHPLTVMNTMFRSWGHQHLYNQETLSALLRGCGFGEIRRYQSGESDDVELCAVEYHGKQVGHEAFNRMHTLVLETKKPG